MHYCNSHFSLALFWLETKSLVQKTEIKYEVTPLHFDSAQRPGCKGCQLIFHILLQKLQLHVCNYTNNICTGMTLAPLFFQELDSYPFVSLSLYLAPEPRSLINQCPFPPWHQVLDFLYKIWTTYFDPHWLPALLWYYEHHGPRIWHQSHFIVLLLAFFSWAYFMISVCFSNSLPISFPNWT